MKISQQINNGILVSAKTKQKLHFDNEHKKLVSGDGQETYFVENNLPWFIEKPQQHDDTFFNNAMEDEYRDFESEPGLVQKVKLFFYGDFETKELRKTFKTFDKYNEDHVLLAIGGGPTRAHKLFTNLNISDYPNVDVVADAHLLPYADNSIDAVHINAVIEHLYNPQQVVSEIFRVLKPGGIVLSITPFMQAYHGYPHHYQNWTLTGHEYNYSSKGFKVLKSGVGIGPMMAWIIITSKYFFNFVPFDIGKVLGSIFLALGMIILKPLDLILSTHPSAHILSSATFVLAKKP